MSRVTDIAHQRRDAALYVPATQRTDCCGRCRHSRAVPYNTSLHCTLHRCQVGSLAVCARWQAILPRFVKCGA